MPMHTDRRRRRRGRRSTLDWFAEDPWAEPDAYTSDREDGGYGDLFETQDDDVMGDFDDPIEVWNEEPFDDWGPIRRRLR